MLDVASGGQACRTLYEKFYLELLPEAVEVEPQKPSDEIFNFGLNALRQRLTQRERIAHLEYTDQLS